MNINVDNIEDYLTEDQKNSIKMTNNMTFSGIRETFLDDDITDSENECLILNELGIIQEVYNEEI